jgi:hypothetical protein
MKKCHPFISIYLFAVLCIGSMFAQAPQGINYQAVVRNSLGNIMSNTPVGIKVSIHQGFPTGTVVYSESFAPTTSSLGLVNLVIGQGNILSGSFSGINWGAGPYYCELGLDPTGGTSYASMGTQEFVSVPYALYAESSGTPGPTGATGATGPAGPTGSMGPTGPTVQRVQQEQQEQQAQQEQQEQQVQRAQQVLPVQPVLLAMHLINLICF